MTSFYRRVEREMSPPRCTVIVLNFNGECLLPACLESLAQQTEAAIETVVVDNGSSDGSARIVTQEYPWVHFIPLGKNFGFSAGNNVGLRYALNRGSEYALLLNNDTFAAPEFIREMMRAIESDVRVAAVCPKIYFAQAPTKLWYAGGDFSLSTSATKHRGWMETDHGQFDESTSISHATGCALLVRCSALQEVGLLDEQFWAYAEDLEWSLRFLKHGYRLAFAPKARLWHHCGATAVGGLGSGSQVMRQFFSTRNMVFVARKHAAWWQTPSYVFGFLINHIAFYTFLRIWKRDFRALWAIYRGLLQGLRTPLRVSAVESFVAKVPSQSETQACATESASGPFTA